MTLKQLARLVPTDRPVAFTLRIGRAVMEFSNIHIDEERDPADNTIRIKATQLCLTYHPAPGRAPAPGTPATQSRPRRRK